MTRRPICHTTKRRKYPTRGAAVEGKLSANISHPGKRHEVRTCDGCRQWHVVEIDE